MAFSKTPTQSTYDTKRVPFMSNPLQRSFLENNKDFRLLNLMVDVVPSPSTGENKFYLKSRPGCIQRTSPVVGEPRGIYVARRVTLGVVENYIISVIADTLYINGVATITLSTTNGQVGFTEFLYPTGDVDLIFVDGTDGYVITNAATGTFFQITHPDFPSPHVPMPVFLDGYLFLAKTDTQDIYNSNLNDPALWSSGDFISAELYADTVTGLAKNNNYIYAFGASSVEFFYDAANPVGSPLARNDTAVLQFGCVSPESIVETEEQVILLSTTSNGEYTVRIIDGFKTVEIGIPSTTEAITEGKGIVMRQNGQKLYILSTETRTFVYSFTTEMWSEWVSGVRMNGTPSFDPWIGFIGREVIGDGSQSTVLGRDGAVYDFSTGLHDDNGEWFIKEITTQKYDFDSLNNKFMHRFSIVGDIPVTDLEDSVFTIRWSDDDYNTWSAPRNLPMFADQPSIYQLGKFRRRAFRIAYSLPYLVRLEGLEVDINQGNS